MNKALEDMLRPYAPATPLDWLQAAREIVQEIALLGFWRGGFFEHAAFYGGTALRLFHGVNRFSEDLDFSLVQERDGVRLEAVLSALEIELAAWGFSFRAEPQAAKKRTGIDSAFLKGDTRVNLLNVGVPEPLGRHFLPGQKIAIKLELDTRPPPHAGFEIKTHLLPTPFQVRLYDLPSLFAGKLHALLYRDWKMRVKGRDFYDFIWFISRHVPVNIPHLEARIRQSGDPAVAHLTLAGLQSLLGARFEKVDLAAAANEVRPYLRDAREITLWSEMFFKDLIPKLTDAGVPHDR